MYTHFPVFLGFINTLTLFSIHFLAKLCTCLGSVTYLEIFNMTSVTLLQFAFFSKLLIFLSMAIELISF